MSEYATMKQANRLFADVKKLQEQMETAFKLLGSYAPEPKEVAQKPFTGLNQQTQLFVQPMIIQALSCIPEVKPKHWETDTLEMKTRRIKDLHTRIEVVDIAYPTSLNAPKSGTYRALSSGLIYSATELMLPGHASELICKEQAETKKLLVKGILKL